VKLRILILAALTIVIMSLNGRSSAFLPPEKAVKFTVAGAESAPLPGGCSATGYANICISGNCVCIEVTKATISGDLVANCAEAFISIDQGLQVSPGGCEPAFAMIASQSLNASCGKFVGTLNLVLTACATHYSGGWDISASSSSGSGTFAGSVNGNKLSLRFQGATLPK
jgi:hypothetical protein